MTGPWLVLGHTSECPISQVAGPSLLTPRISVLVWKSGAEDLSWQVSSQDGSGPADINVMLW